MIGIAFVRLPECLETKYFNLLENNIDLMKKKRLERYFHIKDVYRTLFADILVRYILITSFGYKNNDISYSYNTYGKPSFKIDRNFKFSVSHSGDLVVCVWGNNEVGVDIEKITDICIENVTVGLSKEEHKVCDKLDYSDFKDYFFKLWTSKESYVKAIGTGFISNINNYSVSINDHGAINLTADGTERDYFFRNFNLDDDYCMTVCSEQNNISSNINEVRLEDILKIFKE